MRAIYTSPRTENIDRVVALFAEHGIESTVANRAVYNRSSYKRFSYGASDDRSRWPRVEVSRAADLTRARELLREAGIEPLIRHADVLAEERAVAVGAKRRRTTVTRTRLLVMLALIVAVVMLMLRYMGVIQ